MAHLIPIHYIQISTLTADSEITASTNWYIKFSAPCDVYGYVDVWTNQLELRKINNHEYQNSPLKNANHAIYSYGYYHCYSIVAD